MNVTHAIVIFQYDDGKARIANLLGKQPKQVLGYVRHIQGGSLQLMKDPVIVGFETPPVGNGHPVKAEEVAA